jgi:hypothetical protein
VDRALRAVDEAPRQVADGLQPMRFWVVAGAVSLAALITLMMLVSSAVGATGLSSADGPVSTPSIFAPVSTPAFVIRFLGAHFFDIQAGGSAVLWQYFFWFFGHPEVYVLAIPAFAFASEIIPVFSRKVIFGYRW